MGAAVSLPREQAFRDADDALRRLIGLQASLTQSETLRVERNSELAIAAVCAVSVVALLIAALVAFTIRRHVARPLADITRSLSALAAGDLERSLPESDREDEIGALAKAFDVFRQNFRDLRSAHGEIKAAQARADELARFDPLTGLANRRSLYEEMAAALRDASRERFAVFVLDLDRFKPVNDIHGHSAGDHVLQEIGVRLREVAGDRHFVARLGGDEFAMVVRQDSAEDFTEATISFASRVMAAVSESIAIGNGNGVVGVSTSVGAAVGPGDGNTPQALLKAADLAMYRAKRDGPGTFQFFEAAMEREVRARAELEASLRTAIGEGDIEPFYQPIVKLADGQLAGFEALARWVRADGSVVQPDVFIPLAEETGLIGVLTHQLLERACGDAAFWPQQLTLSVNISPVQLKEPQLAPAILSVLARSGFPPSRLEVEITETALIGDMTVAGQVLAGLQSVGIRIALDDFGTGYSSLCHLRDFNFDKVKIDRSFVQTLREDPSSEKIVSAIVGLGTSLDLPTTAEGIEDIETLALMVDKGCALGQGYYFAKPMPAGEALEYARSHEKGKRRQVGNIRATI